jgi:hypothetical protein
MDLTYCSTSTLLKGMMKLCQILQQRIGWKQQRVAKDSRRFGTIAKQLQNPRKTRVMKEVLFS